MRFFVGLHQPSDAQHLMPTPVFISINRLRDRKGPFTVGDWIMDSGAFTTISQHGGYPRRVDEYASQIARWSRNGRLLAAVSQDYMCEPAMLARTGMSVRDHQRLTIERYITLTTCDVGGTYIMPVLQGYQPDEYLKHLDDYGQLISDGAWIGVGSICKRNSSPQSVAAVLMAIKRARPSLRLHGFGLKSTALASSRVLDSLHSADSMAWSFAARMAGRNRNDWMEARAFVDRLCGQPVQVEFDV